MAMFVAFIFVHEASALICSTITLAVQIFVGWHVVLLNPLTVKQLITNVGVLVLYFISVSALLTMI